MPAYDKRDYSYRFLNTSRRQERSATDDEDANSEEVREREYRRELAELRVDSMSIDIYEALRDRVYELAVPLLNSYGFNSVLVKEFVTGKVNIS